MKTLFSQDSQNDKTTAALRSFGPSTAVLWDSIRSKLAEQLDSQTLANWIDPLEVVDSSTEEIVLAVPNLSFYQEICAEFRELIERTKQDLGFSDISINYIVAGQSRDVRGEATHTSHTDLANGKTSSAEKRNLPEISSTPSAPSQGEDYSESPSQLNHNYTFESFVRGDSNQFAVATCLSAAENPGRAYNPLFIYGSTGLGKTHLLHAVGNRLQQLNKNAVVTYISSERFMNEMIYCIRFNKQWEFRQKYRNCDVFLVDDIQFIAGKKATQEEFFHTFNTLYAAKKQIVITSDLFPKDIPDIEDRLRNRFQWGLIADIQPPSIEHRIAILLSKAEEIGITLAEDVAEYIAKHAKRNVRELEGALHRINAYAALQGEPITMSLAVRTFKDVLGEPPKRMTVEMVQRCVAEHFKLRVADLKSKRRQRAFAHPRQIAMFLSRKLTGASFPEIGERFGGKDHTTVMHNVRKIQDNLEKDLDLKAHVETLERQLEQLS